MSDQSKAVSALLTLIVLGVVVLVGYIAFDSVGQLEDAGDAVENRAETVYGSEYVVVPSDNCYETCGMTATTPEIRQRGILIVADRHDGWVSAYELSEGVAGSFSVEAADTLVAKGLLERRDGDGVFSPTEYRYVGTDGRYEDGLSDSELRELVKNRLYVSGSWTETHELAASVPASEERVERTVSELKADGVVKEGREAESFFAPLAAHTAYAHVTVDHPPAGSNTPGLFGSLLVVIVAVVVIGAIQRIRKTPEVAHE